MAEKLVPREKGFSEWYVDLVLKASPLARLWPQVLILAAIAVATLALASLRFRKKL